MELLLRGVDVDHGRYLKHLVLRVRAVISERYDQPSLADGVQRMTLSKSVGYLQFPILGVSSSGKTPASNTGYVGSIPATPAKFFFASPGSCLKIDDGHAGATSFA